MTSSTAPRPTGHRLATVMTATTATTLAAVATLGVATLAVATATATPAAATAVSATGSTNANAASPGELAVGTVVVVGLFALAIRSLVKRLGRFHLDRHDPMKLKAGGRHHTVHTFTGRVSGTMKGNETRVHGTTTVSGGYGGSYGSVYATTHIGSTNIVHDQFFLEAADGTTQGFQLTNMDVAVADGQLVSVAWVIRKRKKAGPYLLVRNHRTGDVHFSSHTLTTLARGPKHTAALLIACWMLLLAAPALAAAALIGLVPALLAARWIPRLRIRRFRRSGVAPLAWALDATAARGLSPAARATVPAVPPAPPAYTTPVGALGTGR